MWGTEQRRVAVLAGDRIICSDCVVANRPAGRMMGLLGRHSLPESEGILLSPTGSIHTAFMRFSIDVVFLDAEHCVIKLAEHVGPWRIAAARGAKQVLELAAGTAAATGLREGEHLIFAPRRAEARP